jgi:hypothetical protein
LKPLLQKEVCLRGLGALVDGCVGGFC